MVQEGNSNCSVQDDREIGGCGQKEQENEEVLYEKGHCSVLGEM